MPDSAAKGVFIGSAGNNGSAPSPALRWKCLATGIDPSRHNIVLL